MGGIAGSKSVDSRQIPPPFAVQDNLQQTVKDFEVGLKIFHENGKWAIITTISDCIRIDGWHSADGSKFEQYSGQGWPITVAKRFVDIGSWTLVKTESVDAKSSSHSEIVPAIKSLSPFQSCRILYFQDAQKRDKAYRLLVMHFGNYFQHIEPRRTDQPSPIMCQEWIVISELNSYTYEMQQFLKKEGCVEREVESNSYAAVLKNSTSID